MNYIMNKVQQIFQQAPDGVSEEQISKLLEIHDNDSLMVLSILWKLEKEGNEDNEATEQDKTKKKWDNIREICNSYEEEMQNFMKSKQKDNSN